MYVAVQVPEDRLPAVYELLLDRSSSHLAVTAASDDTTESPDPALNVNSAESQLWTRVMPEARDVLKVHVRRPNEELTFDELTEESGVKNVGAAMQSLRIWCGRLGIVCPIVRRRTRNGNRYSMSADTAAQFARLAN